MTLGWNEPFAYAQGNGSTTVFNFGFRAFTDDEGVVGVLVYLEDNDPTSETYGAMTLKAVDVDYTVELTNDPDNPSQTLGGTVTFSTAPTALQNVFIVSETAIEQGFDYTGGGTFPARSHEGAMDKLTRIVQELALPVRASLRFPTFESGDFDMVLPKAAIRANRSFGFDDTGAISMVEAVTQDLIDGLRADAESAETSATAAEAARDAIPAAEDILVDEDIGVTVEARDPDILKADTPDILYTFFGEGLQTYTGTDLFGLVVTRNHIKWTLTATSRFNLMYYGASLPAGWQGTLVFHVYPAGHTLLLSANYKTSGILPDPDPNAGEIRIVIEIFNRRQTIVSLQNIEV